MLFDERPDSTTRGQTQEIYIGEDDYQLVTMPPMIWTSFKCVSTVPAIVANCASLPHDPQEVERRAIDDPAIPYRWDASR